MVNAVSSAYAFVIVFVIYVLVATAILEGYKRTEGRWYHQVVFFVLEFLAICVFGFLF